MHKIREIREYPPIHVLFSRWKEEKDIVFLDSSLENRLGRYSIIGRLPYQKLVQDGDSFCVNDEKQKMTFENYLRTYLKEHPDSNESDLPIVSGAMRPAMSWKRFLPKTRTSTESTSGRRSAEWMFIRRTAW